MRRRVRLGVIGAGVWATTSHLPAIAGRRDEVDLVAVCRPGRNEVDAVGREFGFAVATEDYHEALDAGLDACIVSSPPSLHHEHARAALEAGCHVLLEKPVTFHAWEAWDLVDLARRGDRHIVISFGWNYLPTYLAASELLDRHGIGEIRALSVHMDSGILELLTGTSLSSTGDPKDRADTSTWTSRAVSGGGYAQAALPHALAVALGLCGLRPRRVYALGGGGNDGIELYDAMTVGFEGGAIGTVSGMAHHAGATLRHEVEVRLFGSKGQLHLDYFRDLVRLWSSEGGEMRPAIPAEAGLYDCTGPPNTLIDLALGRPVVNHSPGELGAVTVEVIEAAYVSMASGQPVEVPAGLATPPGAGDLNSATDELD
jgi:predicted dehydrogenase